MSACNRTQLYVFKYLPILFKTIVNFLRSLVKREGLGEVVLPAQLMGDLLLKMRSKYPASA